MNERVTENLVRAELESLGYYAENDELYVEEQNSQIVAVNRLLKNASKSGKGGKGFPEFIVSSPHTPDFLVVFECKADKKHHQSQHGDKPKDFAVDGVLHYGRALAKGYNVVCVAVSGQKSLKKNIFFYPKGASKPKPLSTRHGKVVNDILPFDDFIEHGTFDPEVASQRFSDLMEFSNELHEFMRDHAKLTESEKPLLVSGTLIALKNKAFAKSYGDFDVKDLPNAWLRVIKEEMTRAEIPNSKKLNMTQPYSTISVHPEMGKPTKQYPKGVLHELIDRLNTHVWPFISIYHDFDVVGQFYGEFLKYTGGDKKSLGIVLTPRHITVLFSRLANVGKTDKVLDICCGTGGFLISAMHQMVKDAAKKEEVETVKNEHLIGVEQQPNMYALAASNMILRGDGKANLYQGSCFDSSITTEVKKHKCNIGFLNPPYSQSDEDLDELIFVKHMLDCLDGTTDSYGIAIVPMECAIQPNSLKSDILKEHHLVAVMSMPDLLFYPIGTVTCIMVFRAHRPHKAENKKTWFGYWKDDGFYLMRHRGRRDFDKKWPSICDRWVETFRNGDEIVGYSTKRLVSEDDEWCAEAYMETDYGALAQSTYHEKVKAYIVHELVEGA
jgi:SAM-dependent methyltransferase